MADETRFENLHAIKKGAYILLDGVACKVVDVQISKTGKHGHSKARLTAIGLLDGKKKVIVKPGDARMEIPLIEKGTAQIIKINKHEEKTEGQTIIRYTADVMDLTTYETFNMEIPEELVEKAAEGSQVIYAKITGARVMQRLA